MATLSQLLNVHSLSVFPVVITETSTITTRAEIQRSAAMDSVTAVESASPWPDFDKVVAELRDWLTLLERMLRLQTVTVGDLEEMEEMIVKQKVRYLMCWLKSACVVHREYS